MLTCEPIASGNLIFTSDDSAADVKMALEAKLAGRAGKPVDVLVRTAAEMAKVLADAPFAGVPRNNVAAIFLDTAPPADVAQTARHHADEEIALGTREIYVHYGKTGMGQSKLVIPSARHGTARNLNTVAKLANLAAALD